MITNFVIQGIEQPFYGSSTYGEVVYGSAWPSPPSQAVGWPEFYEAIGRYLISTNIFASGLAFFAIDPDSFDQWPVTNSSFALICPKAMHSSETDIGGGRFVKTWETRIDIHIVTTNVYDRSYSDNLVVTSPSLAFGPYALVHLVIDKFEQAFIKTASGDYATVEFPRSIDIGELHRFKQSIAYVSIPITFEMLVKQRLPSTWLPSAMPPTSEDF